MAASKKKKIVKRSEDPKVEKKVGREKNPDQYYYDFPKWNFKSCDKECWAITDKKVKDCFWDEILPCMQNFETMKWSEIFKAKKKHHSIDVTTLNKVACDRLEELMIECESIVSLRLQGTHRLYGFIEDSSFFLLWVDLDHGDNATCVCRSHQK